MQIRFVILTLAMTFLSSCQPRQQEPFKMVQFCVKNNAGIDILSRELRATAKNEGMHFIDNTKAARNGLAVTAQSPSQQQEAFWLVHFVLQTEDGMGATATNLGLSPFEFGLGFTDAGDINKASSFATRIVKKLEKYWRIIPIAPGVGALPSKECGN